MVFYEFGIVVGFVLGGHARVSAYLLCSGLA